MSRERTDLDRELRRDGWDVSRTRSGHKRAIHPNAASVLFYGGTPSDRRAIKNTRAQARRLLREEEEAS